jgi:hypothetical protein
MKVKLFIQSKKPFSNRWTLLSEAIKLFTKSKWHHSGIIKDGNVFESVARGFLITKTEKELLSKKGHEFLVCEIEIDNEKLTEILGVKYDFVGLIYKAWYQVTGQWIGGDRSDFKRYGLDCASSIAYLLGIKEFYKADPEDLYKQFFTKKGV